MAMGTAGGTGVRSEINITPLVDVVLVLLIIFMVVTPLLQMGYEVTTPPEVEAVVAPPPEAQLIVRLDARGRMFVNQRRVDERALAETVGAAVRARPDRVVFFAADGEVPYGRVAAFLGLVRASGARNLGMVFDDLAPAPP